MLFNREIQKEKKKMITKGQVAMIMLLSLVEIAIILIIIYFYNEMRKRK